VFAILQFIDLFGRYVSLKGTDVGWLVVEDSLHIVVVLVRPRIDVG
jgi:hypothetical protein